MFISSKDVTETETSGSKAECVLIRDGLHDNHCQFSLISREFSMFSTILYIVNRVPQFTT